MYYSRNTEEIAMNINLQSRISINNAFRIARTEGHRIQCEATYNAQNKAKEKGARIIKNGMLLYIKRLGKHIDY